MLYPWSVPGRAVAKALGEEQSPISADTWAEVQEVLRRPKFLPYIKQGTVEPFLADIFALATYVEIPFPIRACRDPKDDKFLEVAVHGRADLIVTGDRDLLDLHPFRGIAILAPAEYLAQS